MEEKDLIEELKSCLALQEEIDAKTLALRTRYKAIVEARRKEPGNLFVEIGGEMYELKREDAAEESYREAMRTAREIKGFYLYRLFKTGKTIRG
jgi:hypothetical protein